MIIQYQLRTATGSVTAWGVWVEVFLAGRRRHMIYQFPGGGQEAALVEFRTGVPLCRIFDRHQIGAPQMTAQAAADEIQTIVPGGPDTEILLPRTDTLNGPVPHFAGPFGRVRADER